MEGSLQIDAEGIRLRVATAGPEAGEPVVLLHGFPESSWAWRRQAGPLAEAGRRVLAPDLRGYGRSDAPVGVGAYRIERLVGDVLAVADAAAAERMVLVGHDWGGIVAWAVAAWHPERVARLVILNAPHLDVFRGVIMRRPGQMLRSAYAAFFQLPGLSEAVLAARDFTLLRRAMTATAKRDTFSADDLERYCQDWRRPGRLTAMLSYYRALARRPRRRIGRVDVPVTLVWGEQDAALSFALAEASLRMCSASRLVRVPEATHWVHLEEPAIVTEAILEG